MKLLTMPYAMLQRLFRGNLFTANEMRMAVGESNWAGNREWLLRTVRSGENQPYFSVFVNNDFAVADKLPEDCVGAVVFGRHYRCGDWHAIVRGDSGVEPIDRLKLVGPGMHILHHPWRQSLPIKTAKESLITERWSRTIGALGVDVFQRLRRLRYGIIGLGRTGSDIALGLRTAWGASRLTLIDPDIVEEHNLGESVGLCPKDIGLPKVQVIARHLRSSEFPSLRLKLCRESITHRKIFWAAQGCDILVGCVDHDSARLAANILAALFYKPYLDIATGVQSLDGNRRMGADIRLMIPGEACVLCLGGLADSVAARRVLSSANAEQAFYIHRDWRHERAGSLRSLNHLAASLAMRLLEDFVGERVTSSIWLHVEYDPDGRLSLWQRPPTLTEHCPLCGELAGMGTSGMAQATALLHGSY
ncbi:MAG: ThiF family adenylyltransferase [Thermoguttaceae bacterium]|jgi:hypothetical protein